MWELWLALVDGMKAIINFLYGFTGTMGMPSYALAIILFTVALKTILYPLTKKQMISMKMMQKVAPKIKEIQQRFKKKDPQKMQQKIMDVYKENNINPLAGCLPILLQMPILIALYHALLTYEFTVLEHAHFFWVESLSYTDPFFILPLLAAATTYLQSKLTMNLQDQMQKIMLYAMPVLIGWIAATLPSGLALYWTVFNLVGAAQQYYINKHFTDTEKGAS